MKYEINLGKNALDDLFKDDKGRKTEEIVPMDIKELKPYAEQPFKVLLDNSKLGKIDYNEAKKRAYEKIYQSVDASFDYDIEFAKDTCYRNIPSVDNSLFTIARKLILAERTPV